MGECPESSTLLACQERENATAMVLLQLMGFEYIIDGMFLAVHAGVDDGYQYPRYGTILGDIAVFVLGVQFLAMWQVLYHESWEAFWRITRKAYHRLRY